MTNLEQKMQEAAAEIVMLQNQSDYETVKVVRLDIALAILREATASHRDALAQLKRAEKAAARDPQVESIGYCSACGQSLDASDELRKLRGDSRWGGFAE